MGYAFRRKPRRCETSRAAQSDALREVADKFGLGGNAARPNLSRKSQCPSVGRLTHGSLLLFGFRSVWQNSGWKIYNSARCAAGPVRTGRQKNLRVMLPVPWRICNKYFGTAKAKTPGTAIQGSKCLCVHSDLRRGLDSRADAPHTKEQVPLDSRVQACHK